MIIKAVDFKYPSRKERQLANQDYPKLLKFGFTGGDMDSILNGNGSFEIYNKQNNLAGWDACFQVKLFDLYQAYINTLTHYNRGVPDGENLTLTQENVINKIQFDFYSETFYYFFFSVRDVLAQILNIYYDLGMVDTDVTIYKVKEKVQDVKPLLELFVTATKEASGIRNSFTHRFPINQPDSRTNLKTENKKMVLEFRGGNSTTPETIIKNINASLLHLSTLLEGLKTKITLQTNHISIIQA